MVRYLCKIPRRSDGFISCKMSFCCCGSSFLKSEEKKKNPADVTTLVSDWALEELSLKDVGCTVGNVGSSVSRVESKRWLLCS